MRKTLFLTAFVLLLASATGNARDQWVIGDKAYEVDTLIFPHLAGPGVTAAKPTSVSWARDSRWAA